jgi:PhnB protein
MSKPNPIPPGVHTVTPHLVCAGAARAMDFYKKAFNAREMMKLEGPDGKLMHGAIMIGDSLVMLADEYPEWNSVGPNALKGTTVALALYVEDADRQFEQAVAAGCSVYMPLEDMFWGDRYGIVRDPYGHLWSIATHIRDVSPEEIQAGASKGCPGN